MHAGVAVAIDNREKAFDGPAVLFSRVVRGDRKLNHVETANTERLKSCDLFSIALDI